MFINVSHTNPPVNRRKRNELVGFPLVCRIIFFESLSSENLSLQSPRKYDKLAATKINGNKEWTWTRRRAKPTIVLFYVYSGA